MRGPADLQGCFKASPGGHQLPSLGYPSHGTGETEQEGRGATHLQYCTCVCRQKEEARQAQEAAKRRQEAESERARRAAYSGALRREADRIAAILAKQVWSPEATAEDTFGAPCESNHNPMLCRVILALAISEIIT